MEADWEVEVGGGSPVIEALWPGFVDLRLYPERIGEIQEAAGFRRLPGCFVAEWSRVVVMDREVRPVGTGGQ